MLIQRTTTRNIVLPADIGMEIRDVGGGPVWWDPNGVGLSIIGAYQAINAPNYATSLVNLANPGVNDLVEGNGIVPWAGPTGWGFVAGALQYFDTGLVPANDQSWSMFVQYNTKVGVSAPAGMSDGGVRQFLISHRVGDIVYFNGGNSGAVVPAAPAAGNNAVVGNRGYRNGIVEGAAIGVWVGASVSSIFLGAGNNGGAPFSFLTANFESAAIYNANSAAVQAEALAIATAMAAL